MKNFTIKIKEKTFGEIPNGTIFKPINSDLYYMKIGAINSNGYIFNAIFATTGNPCFFADDEKIEKVTYKFNEQVFILIN